MPWLKIAPYVGGLAVILALLWYQAHRESIAEQRGYDRRVAEEQKARELSRIQAREEDAYAIQQRTKELAEVHAQYAARTPAFVRVCIPAPSLPGTAEANPSSEDRAPGTGAFSTGDAPQAVTYFDVQPFDELAKEADEIVAACRAYQNRVNM